MNQYLSKQIILFTKLIGRQAKKWDNYEMLKKTQYFSDKELSIFQNERLQLLLNEANRNVPYYKKIFAQLKIVPSDITVESIYKLPYLTKKIIKENSHELLNSNLPKSRLKENSTSGSSGSKTAFYSDVESDNYYAPLTWRSLNWLGIYFGDKELKIWGAMHDINKSREIINRVKNYLNNRQVISSYKMNDEIIDEYNALLNSFKPDQIHAYPSALYEYAKYILKKNFKVHTPKVILTSGEQLYDWQKKVIKEAFSSDVFNFYGCREFSIIAHECKSHEGLHIMAENLIVEVVNENGENIYDEEGELVITDLSNFAFPFIRYKILDRAILTKKKCSCAINLPLLKTINGRSFDLIKLKNDSSIGPTFFTHLFREKPGIDDFRIYQNDLHNILIEYISQEIEPDLDFFKNKIFEHSENLIKVEFKRVNEFNIPESGKRQFIFSKV